MSTEKDLQSTSELPHIKEVKPLSKEDEPILEELKAVLEKHGALQRFGVMLLHDHFPIRDNEVMVEFEEAAQRQLISQPMEKTEVEKYEFIETQWRLDTGQALALCRKVCIVVQGEHTGVSRHG